mgnify:CR=1 FL=1
MIKMLPLVFVILWSSAFITSKVIIDNSSPFAALSFRFLIVTACFLIFSLIIKDKILNNTTSVLQACVSGVLFHGLYLGGVFYSISIGMPASIAALIVSLQPILTNVLSGPLLNERVSWSQWFGIILGFIGAVLVLGFEVGNTISLLAITSTIVALVAATSGTLWQKKISNNLTLTVNNFYQALGAFIFLFLIMILFEKPFINFSYNFIMSMTWQIIVVSFGAFTILMYLIRSGSASKTSSLFFLVPPVSALMAWVFLNETITFYDLIGFCLGSLGVFIATRE